MKKLQEGDMLSPQDAEEMSREHLCEALRSDWHLTAVQIDAILAQRDFFQPYLRAALARRAQLGAVPETPIDETDFNALFLLTEFGDAGIIADLLQCLHMTEPDLEALYADALTEHLWLPFAKLGHASLSQLWEFVSDPSVYLYAKHAVIAGVVAMPQFHPEQRAAVAAFIERLVDDPHDIPDDHLAGILCDCADGGLMELSVRAEQCAERISAGPKSEFPTVTADELRKAFAEGPRKDFITCRAHDVFGVYKDLGEWNERHEREMEDDALDDAEDDGAEAGQHILRPPLRGTAEKIGRNDPCPCGSGKKYKRCHGTE